MSLFDMDLDQITYRDIEEFCLQGLPESVRLDYKRDLSNVSPEKQIVKAVSAFANTQGGIVLYGVRTRGKTKYPEWPSDGMTAPPDFEKRITRWCIEHIDPPIVPMIGYVPNPSHSGRAFGVIRVELSRFTPHIVEDGTRIYVRRADNSDPVDATFQEIELLRNQRERALELEKKHLVDLKERIELRPRTTERCMFLILTRQFSTDDAISLIRLPDAVRELERVGFKVSRTQSYSHGVMARVIPGWDFVVTSRAALAVGFHPDRISENPNEPVTLDAMLGWSLLAAKGIITLCKEAGCWGAYKVIYKAFGYSGIEVRDAQTGERYRPCVDPRIAIEMEWSTLELREDLIKPAAEFFWRMMWAFGQNEQIWSREMIVKHLSNRARDWHMQSHRRHNHNSSEGTLADENTRIAYKCSGNSDRGSTKAPIGALLQSHQPCILRYLHP